MADNQGVECETCREALSARIDGEREPVPAEVVARHLESCAPCVFWYRRAQALTRSLRVRPAPRAPDLVDAILLAAPAVGTRRRRPPAHLAVRIALAVVAVVQVLIAVGPYLGVDFGFGHDHSGEPHLLNESTAWNVALGLGMLWASFRVEHARGMVPVFAGFLVVLAGFSVWDLVRGQAPVERVASHLVLLVGLVLLVVVRRRSSGRSPTPGRPDVGDRRVNEAADRDSRESGEADGSPLPGRHLHSASSERHSWVA
ncbi:zf-HC2 domain-containing protein [Actinoalloteichus caeruleus]|uniref:Anti-sigma-YlaC factor YlaD, contains Zn-finger domain n=1 Tax=Actinoalloteichus caeruleus DSM 43889 TaxID=1120930 RepID=A0ABT1JNF9_ACTCY|nr:zf-HC2 domain-containing protein [Actinoalloteichus caeruleus]MCP2333799.1 putative anti-sigma-YlaC factor YlaD, contains Zn-finger domain [Actinoalloteichus caeruleus DSM 43889]